MAIPSSDSGVKQNRSKADQIKLSMKPTSLPFSISKRLFDLSICLVLIPFVVPLIVVVGLIILLDSGDPVLFKQKRIGQGGIPFTIYKFRTMFHKFDDSEHREFMKQYIGGDTRQANGSFKPPIEKQITRIGRILRNTSLDELPQLLNVLRGEMSIVGPRPNVEWEVQAYEAWHHQRLEVRPGITGLAQINGRSSILFDELVRYDIEYVQNQSLRNDIKIIVQTVVAVLKRSGAG